VTQRHWQSSYGCIPKEINPDAFRSVTELLDQAMKRFAAVRKLNLRGATVGRPPLHPARLQPL